MKTSCLLRNILLVGSISLTLASCGGGGGGGGESSSSGSNNNSGTNNNTQDETLAPVRLNTGMNIEIKYSSGGSDIWNIVSSSSCTNRRQTCTYTYHRTASKVGELNIVYTSGTKEKIQLTFTGKNSGTYVRWTDGAETARGNFVCSNNNAGSNGNTGNSSPSDDTDNNQSDSGNSTPDTPIDTSLAPASMPYPNKIYFPSSVNIFSADSCTNEIGTSSTYTYTKTGDDSARFVIRNVLGSYTHLYTYILTFTEKGKGTYTMKHTSNGSLIDDKSGSFEMLVKTPVSSGSSSSGSGSSSSGSGGSSSGSGSTDDADDENIAPYNLAGVVFRKSYGNEFYSFNTSGMTYSFGSSVDQRYTGGGYSYQRTGPTTGTLRFSNASYRGGYLPYFEYTTTYSSNGTVNLTFSKSSGGKLTVSMSGSATTTTKTTDRTSTPYKTTTKTNSSTISDTFNVEL